MMALLFFGFFMAALLGLAGKPLASTNVAVINLTLCVAWLVYHASDTLSILL